MSIQEDAKIKKVYLDTCIFSRLIDARINEHQLSALDELSENPDLNFVTSKKSFEEFIRTKNDSTRVALKMIYKFIEKIPNQNLIHREMGFNRMAFNRPTFIEDKLFSQLKEIFDPDDSEHIFLCNEGKVRLFFNLRQSNNFK
ncbi:hypothetical protein ACXFAU_11975 [Paenibacillus glucanolyticus]